MSPTPNALIQNGTSFAFSKLGIPRRTGPGVSLLGLVFRFGPAIARVEYHYMIVYAATRVWKEHERRVLCILKQGRHKFLMSFWEMRKDVTRF